MSQLIRPRTCIHVVYFAFDFTEIQIYDERASFSCHIIAIIPEEMMEKSYNTLHSAHLESIS